jgi:ATP-dependent DNA ligase
MLLLRTDKLPADGSRREYQLKLDGYRAIAFKSGRALHLRSRNDNDFSARYAPIVKGLAKLPPETVIDGEVVAIDDEGRPSFQFLQNHGSSGVRLLYFVFDIMMLGGRDVVREPWRVRRQLLETKVLPKLAEPVRYAGALEAPLAELIAAVKRDRLEGLVAKRIDSAYEPGLRSGAWQKMRVNRGQEFVIGGYTLGASPFDALILGYYDNGALVYAARTRNGLLPQHERPCSGGSRRCKRRIVPSRTFPKTRAAAGARALRRRRWYCRWLKPTLVAQFEFVEWTSDGHLRHTRFVALRDDREPQTVIREQ